MKTLLKVGFVVIVVLFSLTTCNLIKDISVGWNINSTFEEGALPGNSYVDINYDVWNSGKYDLSAVKLHFRLYVAASGGYYDVASPEFNINQDQTISNNVIVVDILPYHLGGSDFAEVISVDMDKPKD